jgi:DNA-binding response OmpR family regulator
MPRLILIEDDPAIAESLAIALTTLGHVVRTRESGEAGLEALAHGDGTDLALVDVMLPGIDGFEVTRRIAAAGVVPVILLTARSDPIDIVVGLECGADDYVTKPVEPRVLDARIKTVLRRTVPTSAPTGRHVISLGGSIRFHPDALLLTRDGAPIHLTPTELRLLTEFIAHPLQVLSRRQLLERVWDYGFTGDARLVDAAVQRLRAKLEVETSAPALIATVRGVGYRWDVPADPAGVTPPGPPLRPAGPR